MRKSNLIVLLAVVVLASTAALLIYENRPKLPDTSPLPHGGTRAFSVEQYIVQTINQQSPIRPSAGSSFTVTGISAADGRGVVQYKDDEHAYVADFTYTQNSETGALNIESFIIRG